MDGTVIALLNFNFDMKAVVRGGDTVQPLNQTVGVRASARGDVRDCRLILQPPAKNSLFSRHYCDVLLRVQQWPAADAASISVGADQPCFLRCVGRIEPECAIPHFFNLR